MAFPSITLLSTENPKIGAFEFDAILEDTLEASVVLTNYPIESGARAADHRIIQPYKWSITGIMSNTPIKSSSADLVAGLASNLLGDNGLIAAAAGLSAAFLAGGNNARGASALNTLLNMMVANEPFKVFAGDIVLENMVITKITRTRTPANENGLEFEAQLQELPILATITSGKFVGATQLQMALDDPALNQAATLVDKGQKLLLSLVPIAAAAAAAAVLSK